VVSDIATNLAPRPVVGAATWRM